MQKTIRKIRVKDAELEAVQTNFAQVMIPVLKSDIIDGVLVTDIVLSTGANRVPHTLSRVPLGWVIVDRNAAATVHRTPTGITDSLTMALTASAPITISIWVF